uniref:Protein dpy-30 homolog n=1 Tax=Polyandrocarpa misakiensis TaxID=7723 RepID=A0A3T1CWA7_POLMI|nr:histone methyltransferase complex regulatory subunit dpy-30 [Polyandrocarpa misakiensis]
MADDAATPVSEPMQAETTPQEGTQAADPSPAVTIQGVVKEEKDAAGKTPKMVELQSLPTRAYLDQTVVPILLSGLATLAKERPPNPIEYLAAYLLKNKDEFKPGAQKEQ